MHALVCYAPHYLHDDFFDSMRHLSTSSTTHFSTTQIDNLNTSHRLYNSSSSATRLLGTITSLPAITITMSAQAHNCPYYALTMGLLWFDPPYLLVKKRTKS